jgi:hypothetical protein
VACWCSCPALPPARTIDARCLLLLQLVYATRSHHFCDFPIYSEMTAQLLCDNCHGATLVRCCMRRWAAMALPSVVSHDRPPRNNLQLRLYEHELVNQCLRFGEAVWDAPLRRARAGCIWLQGIVCHFVQLHELTMPSGLGIEDNHTQIRLRLVR